MVKLVVVEKAFKVTLGCGLGDNTESTNMGSFQKKLYITIMMNKKNSHKIN